MKILVVEDEKRVAKYIKKGLELKSFVVDVAHDGQTGLDLAVSEAYDCIILDRMLPQRSGLEVIRQLRTHEIGTPVLMLTAKTEVEDRVEGLESGADDYLAKPFAFVELLARIKALVRRPDGRSHDMLKEGSLTLNMATYEVHRDGQPIELTKKEYALLEFFMRHSGQIITKEQLTQQVWSYESDVLPNTAQVYIGYLRKKIDKAFPNQPDLIHTVRGFGYRFGQASS